MRSPKYVYVLIGPNYLQVDVFPTRKAADLYNTHCAVEGCRVVKYERVSRKKR